MSAITDAYAPRVSITAITSVAVVSPPLVVIDAVQSFVAKFSSIIDILHHEDFI